MEGTVYTVPIKKPQEKILRFFLEVMQAQSYYTLLYSTCMTDYTIPDDSYLI